MRERNGTSFGFGNYTTFSQQKTNSLLLYTKVNRMFLEPFVQVLWSSMKHLIESPKKYHNKSATSNCFQYKSDSDPISLEMYFSLLTNIIVVSLAQLQGPAITIKQAF